MGVACDVLAPSLIPVRAGDRVKTDRRDAKKLVRLYRGGALSYVHPPPLEAEGLRDLLRCRDDLRRAWIAARNRVAKQLLRHGRVFREGKHLWTQKHREWVNRQRLEEIARSERWAPQVQVLERFRGIATLTALGLISEIGDFARFSNPRELMSWLGMTPTEYSSGQQQHRGHITRAGNAHARRLLCEAAWHYRHPPRRSARRPEPDERAWQAQVRLFHRWRHLTEHGKRSTVANIAIARELAGFIWAAMTDQPSKPIPDREEVAA
jgi:transposase